jgi:hypothetical protein
MGGVIVNRCIWLAVLAGVVVAMVVGCASSGGDAPAPAADVPPVNTLKWTTASEVDNFGFDIYRSPAEDGSFDRITSEPLAGAGTTDEPQSYVFVDDDIDPTKDYYYYIESISLGGVRETFSPVIRSPAKRPAD